MLICCLESQATVSKGSNGTFMGGLFAFIFKIRFFLLFIIMEVGCLTLMYSENQYQKAAWISSSQQATAEVMAFNSAARGYLNLVDVNEALAAENARLSQDLLRLRQAMTAAQMDTMRIDTGLQQYKYVVAQVVNNSVFRVNNFLTLDKGRKDGIAPGMGVLAPNGVVGRVKHVSDNYATITSLLNANFKLAVSIKRLNASGTLEWQGGDPGLAVLRNIPRHNKPKVGDTLVTSVYSSVFPAGLTIGRISNITVNDNDAFYEIGVRLTTNFSTLNYVYVIQNYQRTERDSLESLNIQKDHE